MTQFVDMCCGECGIEFRVPDHFDRERRKTGKGWYCPNGHCRAYRESEADKERRRAERAEQEIARWRELAAQSERSAVAYKGQATRLRNRAKAGVCSCCNRHFENVERHMKTKHPDMAQP